MRKIALILAVVMLMTALATPALAAQPRAVTIIPELDFDGYTATCSVRIAGNSTSDKMVAAIRLWRGNNLLAATWTATGNGYIFFSRQTTVIKGQTYRLTVDLTINGEACSQVYVTGTCPN